MSELQFSIQQCARRAQGSVFTVLCSCWSSTLPADLPMNSVHSLLGFTEASANISKLFHQPVPKIVTATTKFLGRNGFVLQTLHPVICARWLKGGETGLGRRFLSVAQPMAGWFHCFWVCRGWNVPVEGRGRAQLLTSQKDRKV